MINIKASLAAHAITKTMIMSRRPKGFDGESSLSRCSFMAEKLWFKNQSIADAAIKHETGRRFKHKFYRQ